MMALQMGSTASPSPSPSQRHLPSNHVPTSIAHTSTTPTPTPTPTPTQPHHSILPLILISTVCREGSGCSVPLEGADHSLSPVLFHPHYTLHSVYTLYKTLVQSLHLSNALYSFSMSDTPALTVCGCMWMTHTH